MALPSSGAISFSDINTELGNSASATISLNQADVRGLFGIASGAISMNQGYGCSDTPANPTQIGTCYSAFGGWYVGGWSHCCAGCWFIFDSGSNNSATQYTFATTGSASNFGPGTTYQNGGMFKCCYCAGCATPGGCPHPSMDNYLANFSCRGFTDWYWIGGSRFDSIPYNQIPGIDQGEWTQPYGFSNYPGPGGTGGGGNFVPGGSPQCGYLGPNFDGYPYWTTSYQEQAQYIQMYGASAGNDKPSPFSTQTHATVGHRPVRQYYDPN